MSAAGGGSPPSQADERMARYLSTGGEQPLSEARKQLRGEDGEDAEDLLSRLNALDYLDSVVGEVGSDLPQRLGEYRITGLLGRGGMGTVFAAFQESLEREVALKILAPTMTADPSMRKRFRTEARANAALHHQHIVPVFGFGEASGFLYFTMERVDGVSLDKHISAARHRKEVAMEPLEAARRFAGVADALGHAHKRGVLHRDVKPGNILVHPDGELALADFGLSKMLGEASVSISRAGFLGTLHYASPEQARGVAVGPASDLYSLGVTMFEALTGHLPLVGKTTEAILQSLLHGTPRRLREFLPKTGKDLDAVLRKLLNKEPSERYSDGEALARDLLRVADGEPVRIRRQSLVVLAWRQVRKHPALSSAVLVATVLFLVSLGLWRTNDQQRVSTRFENLIAEAMSTAEREQGAAAGPARLLQSLTGLSVREMPVASRVLSLLDDAARLVPDEPRPGRLKMSYMRDPLSEATEYLLEGRGQEAKRLLDGAIEGLESRTGFAGRDEATWLELYRLYIARAVGEMSVSVSRPEDASKDLIRASLVRPGAYMPQMLEAFLDWDPALGTPRLLNALDDLIAEAPTGAQHAVGAMLLSFSGLSRPATANLMPFEIAYGDRRILHERAGELLGEQWSGLPEEQRQELSGPIEATLAENAANALENLSDRPRANFFLEAGKKMFADLSPSSSLQAWKLVYALLEGSRVVPLIATAGVSRPMSVEIQLRAWRSLLALEPPESLLKDLPPMLNELLTLSGSVALAKQVQALFLAMRADSDPQAALDAAQAWVQAEVDNPDAYLCRFRCHLRTGSIEQAGYDGVVAVQLSADSLAMRKRITTLLSAVMKGGARVEHREAINDLYQGFSTGTE